MIHILSGEKKIVGEYYAIYNGKVQNKRITIAKYSGNLWFKPVVTYRLYKAGLKKREMHETRGGMMPMINEGDELYKLTDQEVFKHVMLEDI
jgi:hypothetical protein